MDVRSCGMQGPPAERQLLRVRKTLIDKGLRLATIGVKAAGVCCTCASAPLSKASLRLRCSTPGSCACCQLRKTRRDSGRSLSAPKEISCLPLDKDLHGCPVLRDAGTTSREATAACEEDPDRQRAETCNDRREGSGRVLHLRLRSAQQGFAPTPVQHTGQLCLLPAGKTRRDSGRSLSAPKEISCLPLDKDLHGSRLFGQVAKRARAARPTHLVNDNDKIMPYQACV